MKVIFISFAIVLIVASIPSINSDIGFGRCKVQPSPNVVQNFELPKYMGKWYEQFRGNNVPFQKGECTTADYTLKDNYVEVLNSELKEGSTTRNSVLGKAVCPTSEAKCKVSFGTSIFSKFTEGNYWVYETDYENYSIVYSCTEYFYIYHLEFVWVLTRERNPNEITKTKIAEALKTLKYPVEDIRKKTYHGDDCIY